MKAIKTFPLLITGLVLTFGLSLSACKKSNPGPKGATGATGETGPAGPGAKTYTVDFTYNMGDIAKSFTEVTDYDQDDAILCYLIINSGTTYLQLPTTYEGIEYAVTNSIYSGTTGAVQVNTYDASDGYSSPWTSSSPWTLHYKFVHIKSSGIKQHPNVDFSDYEEVKKVFDL